MIFRIKKYKDLVDYFVILANLGESLKDSCANGRIYAQIKGESALESRANLRANLTRFAYKIRPKILIDSLSSF